jgi:TRAP-type mannitol/chloroaromatic compound transport system permease small subunit
VNLLGVVFLLLPTIGLVLWAAWPYVLLSWQRLEQSAEAGGMHGLFLWKSAMIVFCVLLVLQGLALALRSIFILLQRPDPDQFPPDQVTGI